MSKYASILLVALSTLSSALPLWDPPACKYHPVSFTIGDFSVFTPATTNPSPYKTISFKYDVTTAGNNPNTFGTSCTHVGLDVENPDYPFLCQNGHFKWTWNGKSLTVGEDYYSPCNNVTEIQHQYGDIADVGLNCYPVVSPYPLGDGTLCQPPVGQLSGEFSRETLKAGEFEMAVVFRAGVEKYRRGGWS